MARLELIPRERTNHTKWIKDRGPFFVSLHEDGIELWRSNMPYAVNVRLHKFPAGYEPTLDDVDEVLAENLL